MKRERIRLVVFVDLDPIPGAFHTKQSAQEIVQAMLLNNIGHYHPVVTAPQDRDTE